MTSIRSIDTVDVAPHVEPLNYENLTLDPNREEYYKILTGRLSDLSDPTEMVAYWLNMASMHTTHKTAENFNAQDLRGLRVLSQDPQVETVNGVLGTNVQRPILQLPILVLRSVREKLTGIKSISAGFTMTFPYFDPLNDFNYYYGNMPIGAISLIFTGKTPWTPEYKRHETMHSIDPNIYVRTPQNRILAEAAASYIERIRPQLHRHHVKDHYGEQSSSRTHWFNSNVSLGYLRSNLAVSYEEYGDGYDTPEEYKGALNKVYGAIKRLEQHLDGPQINIALLNAVNIEQLVVLANRLDSPIKREAVPTIAQ